MVKINVISDLHIDFADVTLPGGDILVISGDTCEAKSVKKNMYNPNLVMLPHENPLRRPDRFYRFYEEECSKKYAHTVVVMGNHEHYGMTFQKTWLHLIGQMPDNVHLLEKESFEIEDVVFVGATLWTDMNKGDWHTMYHVKHSMADYRYITMYNEAKNVYHKLIPEFTVQEFFKSRDYIKHVVENDPNKKFVVVTHHAPSSLSTSPQYVNDTLMNGGYHSDLSDFILDHPQIKLWTHGHMHEKFDYMIGDTRVVCNPRGYIGHEPRAVMFDPKAFEIEL
ncbi:MAG TPA: metallophosphoesterase [Methanosarcina sp.]|nr:metallophosphoesterase [Methanosarcina sp.]